MHSLAAACQTDDALLLLGSCRPMLQPTVIYVRHCGVVSDLTNRLVWACGGKRCEVVSSHSTPMSDLREYERLIDGLDRQSSSCPVHGVYWSPTTGFAAGFDVVSTWPLVTITEEFERASIPECNIEPSLYY